MNVIQVASTKLEVSSTPNSYSHIQMKTDGAPLPMLDCKDLCAQARSSKARLFY